MEQPVKPNRFDHVSEAVREYYGKTLKSKSDLKTGACCDPGSMEPHLREIAKTLHPEVTEKFYGCGSPIPSALEGLTVLDLGCGTGRDCYILSRLMGPEGRVIGVDMTEEQLAVAKRHINYHTDAFGYNRPNVDFRHGYMEDLGALGIEDNSVDLVVSNCVINLSPDKGRVFSEIFRVLKPGGELYFSDVFADRRLPEELANDPLLIGECLGGAMYTEDFRRLMQELGCSDFRQVSVSPVPLTDPDIERRAGMIHFSSVTVRAFKLDDLEDRCEDFGQVAYYRGTVEESPHRFRLDDHHLFNTGMPVPVCGNTASMLQNSRYGKHFTVTGDRSVHYGLFDCAPPQDGGEPSGGCC